MGVLSIKEKCKVGKGSWRSWYMFGSWSKRGNKAFLFCLLFPTIFPCFLLLLSFLLFSFCNSYFIFFFCDFHQYIIHVCNVLCILRYINAVFLLNQTHKSNLIDMVRKCSALRSL